MSLASRILITIYAFTLELSRVSSLIAILLSAIAVGITRLGPPISLVKLRPSILILLLLRSKTFPRHPRFPISLRVPPRSYY